MPDPGGDDFMEVFSPPRLCPVFKQKSAKATLSVARGWAGKGVSIPAPTDFPWCPGKALCPSEHSKDRCRVGSRTETAAFHLTGTWPRKVDILTGWNLTDKPTAHELKRQTNMRKPKALMLSPPCTAHMGPMLILASLGPQAGIPGPALGRI